MKPDDETYAAMQKLRKKIQAKYRLATTSGFGPRFLHSTGQLHKGDAGNGYLYSLLPKCLKMLRFPMKQERRLHR